MDSSDPAMIPYARSKEQGQNYLFNDSYCSVTNGSLVWFLFKYVVFNNRLIAKRVKMWLNSANTTLVIRQHVVSFHHIRGSDLLYSDCSFVLF